MYWKLELQYNNDVVGVGVDTIRLGLGYLYWAILTHISLLSQGKLIKVIKVRALR